MEKNEANPERKYFRNDKDGHKISLQIGEKSSIVEGTGEVTELYNRERNVPNRYLVEFDNSIEVDLSGEHGDQGGIDISNFGSSEIGIEGYTQENKLKDSTSSQKINEIEKDIARIKTQQEGLRESIRDNVLKPVAIGGSLSAGTLATIVGINGSILAVPIAIVSLLFFSSVLIIKYGSTA